MGDERKMWLMVVGMVLFFSGVIYYRVSGGGGFYADEPVTDADKVLDKLNNIQVLLVVLLGLKLFGRR